MNTQYIKIIQKGFSVLPKSDKYGYDRLYLLKNSIVIDYVEFKNNRRTSTVENFEKARENSHRDVAMWKLNNNIENGFYN